MPALRPESLPVVLSFLEYLLSARTGKAALGYPLPYVGMHPNDRIH